MPIKFPHSRSYLYTLEMRPACARGTAAPWLSVTKRHPLMYCARAQCATSHPVGCTATAVIGIMSPVQAPAHRCLTFLKSELCCSCTAFKYPSRFHEGELNAAHRKMPMSDITGCLAYPLKHAGEPLFKGAHSGTISFAKICYRFQLLKHLHCAV